MARDEKRAGADRGGAFDARSHHTRGHPARDLAALALLGFAIAGFLLARAPIVAMAPGLASLYERLGLPVNRVGLAFEDVRALRDSQDGAAGLVVEGAIRNVTATGRDVPPIRLVLFDAGGNAVKSWSAPPDKSRLAGRETWKFRTRIATPPDEARKVSVGFALAATEFAN